MKSKLVIWGVVGIMTFFSFGCTAKKAPEDVSSTSKNHPVATSGASDKTTSDEMSNRINAIIDKKFPGEWSVDGNTLKKGSYTENSGFGIVDEIASNISGSMASIYVDETRISNTLKNQDGSRILVYDIPAEVSKVMQSGKTIELSVKGPSGSPFQKFYIPIKEDSKTIGVIGISMKVK